ncbi:hypothetical protein EJ08DRAFT_69985 [Tothia fuscella]|uniref:Uncharacterized protein n=1 Tax=Tothia fuscella TaxID=1048955 RepID=A0A9P4TSN9_9PEZI|nr:hypothetical protein EJ08DRAFT_69985 [Tothia fuscella]
MHDTGRKRTARLERVARYSTLLCIRPVFLLTPIAMPTGYTLHAILISFNLPANSFQSRSHARNIQPKVVSAIFIVTISRPIKNNEVEDKVLP